jgi:hypothetical protein
MARTPTRHRPPMGSRDAAEVAFKSATTRTSRPRKRRPCRARRSSCPCASRATCSTTSRRTARAGRTGSSRRCGQRRGNEGA